MTSVGSGQLRRQEILPGFPAFAQELAGTLAVHAQYVLHGNIRDQFLMPPPDAASADGLRPTHLLPLLWHALRPSGYECFIVYDPVDGITVYPPEIPDARAAATTLLGSRVIGRKPPLEKLRSHLAKVAGLPEPPPIDGEPVQQQAEQPAAGTAGVALAAEDVRRPRAAFVIDFAARITRVPGTLEPIERDFFLFCQKLALTAKPNLGGPRERPAPLFNPIIWLVEGERDLPVWLTAGVERIRTIAIPTPSLAERTTAGRVFAPLIARRELTVDDERHITEFARRTDGMTIQSMMEVARLAMDRGLVLDQIADAVRVYKLGIEDNPWRRSSVREQIGKGEIEIQESVRGQHTAVIKTLDILKRAALGLSGAQATSTATRPRGTLFFAGPTGVGKTQLAKQVAEILFGDAHAYLRFDMSEFAADHAADRLIGAPPGYVGFEAGGELTGAVRRKPFQVILFDEIEKAHPLVLDKFLQILEDGRLTDGQGITTYFSECVLIFTSNLGIIVTDPDSGKREQIVFPETPYAELETKVKAAIRTHFTIRIARPELLNRLGDNIVVFDFIREEAAGQIFDDQLRKVRDRLRHEHQIELDLDENAARRLREACVHDLSEGGRGIGNKLESRLINPLARYLFDHDCREGTRIRIQAINEDRGVAVLQVSQTP